MEVQTVSMRNIESMVLQVSPKLNGTSLSNSHPNQRRNSLTNCRSFKPCKQTKILTLSTPSSWKNGAHQPNLTNLTINKKEDLNKRFNISQTTEKCLVPRKTKDSFNERLKHPRPKRLQQSNLRCKELIKLSTKVWMDLKRFWRPNQDRIAVYCRANHWCRKASWKTQFLRATCRYSTIGTTTFGENFLAWWSMAASMDRLACSSVNTIKTTSFRKVAKTCSNISNSLRQPECLTISSWTV